MNIEKAVNEIKIAYSPESVIVKYFEDNDKIQIDFTFDVPEMGYIEYCIGVCADKYLINRSNTDIIKIQFDMRMSSLQHSINKKRKENEINNNSGC